MQYDGYALIEINLDGDGRVKEVHYFDCRLENCDIEEDMAEQITAQLPQGINDVMVMALFKVDWLMSYSFEGGHECDGTNIQLQAHHIVIPNYKEFYREQVTELTKFLDNPLLENLYGVEAENIMKKDIAEWEEFYGEDFIPYVKPPRTIFKTVDLLKGD